MIGAVPQRVISGEESLNGLGGIGEPVERERVQDGGNGADRVTGSPRQLINVENSGIANIGGEVTQGGHHFPDCRRVLLRQALGRVFAVSACCGSVRPDDR